LQLAVVDRGVQTEAVAVVALVVYFMRLTRFYQSLTTMLPLVAAVQVAQVATALVGKIQL
jgi:hypothetical protein